MLPASLHKAFEDRNEKFVEHFLKNTDVAAIATSCNFLLLSAIKNKMWKISQLLIRLNFSINVVDENGRTPLINCLFKPRIIRKYDSTVSISDNTEPFTSDHQDVIKILLEHPDIDFTIIDNDGRSALNYILIHESVFRDADEETKMKMIKLFLRKGVNIDAQNSVGIPFLHDAVEINSLKIIQFLMTDIADVNAIDKHGQTAFHVAMHGCWHRGITDLFLQYEINLNSKNQYGESLLYTACQVRNEKVMNILLEKNVDINEITNDGETALHAVSGYISFRDPKSQRCFHLLMKYKPEVNHVNKYGNTALHHAAEGSYKEAVEILLENGAEVNVENVQGETPLHLAVTREHICNVELLLKYGAKVNFPEGKDSAPLLIALHLNSVEIFECLLKSGADPNVKDSSGKTILQLAYEDEDMYEGVISLLRKYGADFSLIDDNGETSHDSDITDENDDTPHDSDITDENDESSSDEFC